MKGVMGCAVFHPTEEEFKDPLEYIAHIRDTQDAASTGICKIVPPASYKPQLHPGMRSERTQFEISERKMQTHQSTDNGIQYQTQPNHITMPAFRKLGSETLKQYFPQLHGAQDKTFADVEQLFWDTVAQHPDGLEGPTRYCGFNKEMRGDMVGGKSWDLAHLSARPQSLLRFLEHGIPGVTSPVVRLSMLYSMLCWQSNDDDLYRITYSHGKGQPTVWYGVPGAMAEPFEAAFNARFAVDVQQVLPSARCYVLGVLAFGFGAASSPPRSPAQRRRDTHVAGKKG
jgi:histone demethylase JARID1